MKRTLSLLLALMMVFALAACSDTADGDDSGKTEETTEPEDIKIADDTATFAMSFTAPKGFETVRRYIEETVDGKITEKNIGYFMPKDKELTYAYGADIHIEDVLDLDSLEKKVQDGQTFCYRFQNDDFQAFAQVGDAVYALQYKTDNEEDGIRALEAVTFTDAEDTIRNNRDLGDFKYTIDEALPLYGYGSDILQKPDGEEVEKTVMWKFGKDNIDFRFSVHIYRNTTVAEKKDAAKEYDEKTINGVDYFVLKPSEDKKAYEYYTQHGDDVYVIRNNGSSNGWFTSRSEESEAAFEKFINSVSFG